MLHNASLHLHMIVVSEKHLGSTINVLHVNNSNGSSTLSSRAMCN